VSTTESLVERYVKAYREVARNIRCEERVFEDMKLVDACIQAEPELFRQIGNPSIDRIRKKQLLETAFGKTVHEVTLRFFRLLINRSRTELLPAVYPAMCGLRDKERKVKELTVTSARPIPADQRTAFERRLKRQFGKNAVFTYKTEEKLIGGFTVAAEGIEIDCSIRSELRELKENLSA
jgi:F-type H+-transporting ATPase subunit delta